MTIPVGGNINKIVLKTQNNRDDIANGSGRDLDLLPCAIDYSGPANTSVYFLRKQRDVINECEGSFRGRRLIGRKVALPKGYTVHVLKESLIDEYDSCENGFELAEDASDSAIEESSSKEQRRLLDTSELFDSIIVWEHDRAPLDDDSFIRSLDWIDVSKCIHGDCSE